ncbi:hypothetical protein FNF29_07145 [Cafeteria roenbergensis]|uniref:Uncharacterized protein n=1 Tax=Cafeteria roenbergensis TaxID=33653 RepID=A0A5A8DJ07_CAFRO|nr:hypothetical protein FNF29_07145 [Cafeteria roenbergensis]KAA0164060.1 hypothetical protein FNF31_02609 [Cafeteria roenbergensis]|eukprot:KAA0147801.1 hypothetical protein FNF29_07145 [Cafeteria roenbergensis]
MPRLVAASLAAAALAGVSAAGGRFGNKLQFELLPYDPTAPNASIVTADGGKARFTILTDRLVRMQYINGSMPDPSVLDAATLAFVNRNLPQVDFTATPKGNGVVISTPSVLITYTGGPFTAASLSVTSRDPSSAFTSWDGGMRSADDPGNLLGTFRTLDGTGNVTLNCTQNGKEHCVWGVLSRSGWALVEDQDNAVLDEHDWPFDTFGQLYPRPEISDWYLFAYGHDYRGALAAFGKVSGAMAMPPRAALGTWFTRWFDYSNIDVRDLIDAYRSRDVPLDILVLDMNWHKKNDWTGYSFDTNLYPVPADLGDLVRNAEGLMTLVNLHDADGVGSWENEFQALCNTLGVDCSGLQSLPADFVNRTAMNALEDVVWQPVQQQYADYAWIDWQQGEHGGKMPGGKANPTIQLNKVRNTDPKRRAAGSGASIKRGMQLGRFGGYGNQRYPVGFSGDVAGVVWPNLAYQPYFTMTSSNAGGFGYWSHDIMGPGLDHELFTRWLAWGSLSPVMRSHERGQSAGGCKDPFPDFDNGDFKCSLVMPWHAPNYFFEANRKALQRRAEMVPYLYTAAREAFDSQVPLMRPLYYDWPESQEAYAVDSAGTMTNYMLGPILLVSPITEPTGDDKLVSKSTWVPPGTWVETETGQTIQGPKLFSRAYSMSQTPIFAVAGSIMPFRPLRSGDMIGTAKRVYTALGFVLHSGALSGSGTAYEDDGETTAYLKGDYNTLLVTQNTTADRLNTQIELEVQGTFSGAPATRFLSFALMNKPPPAAPISWSTKSGATGTLPFSRWGGFGSWSWIGSDAALLVELPPLSAADVASGVTIDITYTAQGAAASQELETVGLRGVMANAQLAKAALDLTRQTPGAHTPDPAYLSQLTALADGLSYWAGNDPARWAAEISNASTLLKAAIAETKAMAPPPPGSLVQMHDTSRKDSLLCGTEACLLSNLQYAQVRIEGYQPSASASGTIKLNDYWDADANDNFASTASSPPAGYSPATFANGLVYQSQEEGSVPLFCYYSSADQDHAAVATPEGIARVQKADYKLCDQFPGGVMGYVLTKPSAGWGHGAPRETALGAVDVNRLAYALGLLTSISS